MTGSDLNPTRCLHNGSDYELYITAINCDTDRSGRKDEERRAVSTLVSEIFGNMELKHDDNGAPFIDGLEDIRVSISHCREFCTLAVCRKGLPVGVDIENPRSQLVRVMNKFLTRTEMARLTSKDAGSTPQRPSELLRYWTAKEAVFKAALTPGLSLKEIEVAADFKSASTRHRHYRLEEMTLPTGQNISVAFQPRPDEGAPTVQKP